MTTVELFKEITKLLDISVPCVVEKEYDKMYGYYWFETEDNSVHIFFCELPEMVKDEMGDGGNENSIIYNVIISKIKTVYNEVINTDENMILPIFYVLHEIGHYLACQPNLKEYEKRGIEQNRQWQALKEKIEADQSDNYYQAKHELAVSYRELPLEKEADEFALRNINNMIYKLREKLEQRDEKQSS